MFSYTIWAQTIVKKWGVQESMFGSARYLSRAALPAYWAKKPVIVSVREVNSPLPHFAKYDRWTSHKSNVVAKPSEPAFTTELINTRLAACRSVPKVATTAHDKKNGACMGPGRGREALQSSVWKVES